MFAPGNKRLYTNINLTWQTHGNLETYHYFRECSSQNQFDVWVRRIDVTPRALWGLSSV